MGRALLAGVLAGGVAFVPVARVDACSCGGSANPIRDADIAFIGVVVAQREPENTTGFEHAMYAFDVKRAKGPMRSPVGVLTWYGNGANCGFDMAPRQRWLVIARLEDGRPRTDLCTGTVRWADLDGDQRRHALRQLRERPDPGGTGLEDVAAFVPAEGLLPGDELAQPPPGPASATPGGLLPPLAVAAAGLALLLGVSALVFLRAGRR